MSRSILYLDDEPRQLELFAEMFRPDYDVRTATTVVAARRLLADRPADIIVSDQRLTESNGKQFLRACAQDYPASYRILLTGAARVGDVLPELAGGVIHAFVSKPWTEEEMRHVLERADAHLKPHARSRRPRDKGK